MKNIETYGNYSVVEYSNSLVTIDFSNENVGLTIKGFSNKENALEVFKKTVKKLTPRKSKIYNDEIRKLIIYSS